MTATRPHTIIGQSKKKPATAMMLIQKKFHLLCLSIPLILAANSIRVSFVVTNEPINNERQSDFVVDVVVTGSVSRPHYAATQKRTWGSHVSVRNFWIVDERQDDFFPECVNQTAQYAYDISRHCKRRFPKSSIDKTFKNLFARIQWLQNKFNPAGWMCAQTRIPYNFAKILSSIEKLPDYLIVIDDDSYVNLEWFQQKMSELDSLVPAVYAGCLVREPVHMINWTIPFGGWGTFYSKGSLKRMLKPLYCNNITGVNATLESFSDDLDFEGSACLRLQENLIGESSLWHPGMNLAELMKKMVSQKPNCLHSDWTLAYFINYYFISRHVDENYYKGVVQSRLHSLDNSELYGNKRRTGNCKNYGGSLANLERWMTPCNPNSHVCHYVTADEISNVSAMVGAQFSDRFTKRE